MISYLWFTLPISVSLCFLHRFLYAFRSPVSYCKKNPACCEYCASNCFDLPHPVLIDELFFLLFLDLSSFIHVVVLTIPKSVFFSLFYDLIASHFVLLSQIKSAVTIMRFTRGLELLENNVKTRTMFFNIQISDVTMVA